MTKLESVVDTIRKAYPKMLPADAALVASALSLTGRHAKAVYEGEYFLWPQDNDKLMRAMSSHINAVNEAIAEESPAPTKKSAKAPVVEEEAVTINIGLAPNPEAGEALLKGREDLKTLLSDLLQEGVEFSYAGSDIGWQWALDRANWHTISSGELNRRIAVKATFTEGAVGVEQGAGPKKRTAKKA